MSDQLALGEVAKWVHANSDYKKAPEKPAIVVRLEIQFFADVFCNGVVAGCAAGGAYFDETAVLMILDDTPDYYLKSVVLHEYVHYLQFLDHGVDRGCAMSFMEEYEAYRLQYKYRVEVEGYKGLFLMPGRACTE